jgi:hypothetical protein
MLPNHYNTLEEKNEPVKRLPHIEGDWWKLTGMPDLGELASPEGKENIVDHGFLQLPDGTWQLWACMRGTKVSRLLYGWKGESLESENWEETGVVSRAEKKYGEVDNGKGTEQIGAPFFFRENNMYYCFYHSGGLRIMTSQDGINYTKSENGKLRTVGGRDAMVMKVDDTYFLYSTVSTSSKEGFPRGFAIVETAKDLQDWKDYTVVSEGGVAGNGNVSAESPFVVRVDGYYYLFRASSITFKTYVYRSDTPCHFGVNDDSKLIAEFDIKAPELVLHEGQWYISDLNDFKGIMMAKLSWH